VLDMTIAGLLTVLAIGTLTGELDLCVLVASRRPR